MRLIMQLQNLGKQKQTEAAVVWHTAWHTAERLGQPRATVITTITTIKEIKNFLA